MAMGRPSILTDAVKEQIIRMYEQSLTDAQVAKVLGVTEQTVKNWKKKDDDFFIALKEAKEIADEAVEASLFKRATGYSMKSVKIFFDAKTGMTIEHEYIEHFAPDPTSMIFWLKNRQPSEWRDKRELEIPEGSISIKIQKDDEEL